MDRMTVIAFTGRMVGGVCSSRPSREHLLELVSGAPETVYVLHNGVPAQLIVNGEGHALGLPRNASATEIYWAYTRSKGGTTTDYFIAGDVVLLEGVACTETELVL